MQGKTREDLAREFGIDVQSVCVTASFSGGSASTVGLSVARGGLTGPDENGAMTVAPVKTDDAGMGIIANTITLHFAAAGGSVTGEGLIHTREYGDPDRCPGAVDESRMTMAFSGVYDAATGMMTGTAELRGYSVVTQITCEALRAEDDGTASATWSARLSGNALSGTLVTHAGDSLPFLLTVGE